MNAERLEELLASHGSGPEQGELLATIDSDPAAASAAGWDLLIDRLLAHPRLRAERPVPARPLRVLPFVASIAAALAISVGIVWWIAIPRTVVPIAPGAGVARWRVIFDVGGSVRTVPDSGGPAVDRPDLDRPREGVVSPNGARVLTVSKEDGDFEIWVADRGGAGRRKLTDNDAFDGGPTWSPDGRRIAFISTRGGTQQIWVMEADGTVARQITTETDGAGDPQWSPSGEWIAYVPLPRQIPDSLNPPGKGICLVRPDGTGRRSVFEGPMLGDYAWDPDGGRIATSRDGKLWVYSVADGRTEAFASFATIMPALSEGYEAWKLHWRPDGRAVACTLMFLAQTSEEFKIHGGKQLYVFDLSGKGRELSFASRPRVLGWELDHSFVRSAAVTYFNDRPGPPLEVPNADLWKLISFFPEMGRGRRGGPPAGWKALAKIRFETVNGPITVSVPINPIDVWSEGNGDWPADPALKPYLRALVGRGPP